VLVFFNDIMVYSLNLNTRVQHLVEVGGGSKGVLQQQIED